MSETYNALITSLGKRFDQFSTGQLAEFCLCLSKVGLRQEDIIGETIRKIQKITKSEQSGLKGTEEKKPMKISDVTKVRFYQTILPLFYTLVDLDLVDSELMKTLTSDEFIKQACNGELTFSESLTRGNLFDADRSLLYILKGKLD